MDEHSGLQFNKIERHIFLGDTMFKLKPSHFLAPSKNHFENLWSINCQKCGIYFVYVVMPFLRYWVSLSLLNEILPLTFSLLWKCFSHWFFQYKRVSKDEWYLLLLLIASWRLFSGRKLCSIHQEFVCLYIYCGYKWGCME